MNIGFGLRLEQTQKLIMTPELRQAIKILQLSSLELNDYVNQAIMENPLIEIKEEEQRPDGDKKAADPDINWQEYVRGVRDMQVMPDSRAPREVKEEISFENYIIRGVNLEEHLLSQLGLIPLSKGDQRVARYLIGNIDSAGYLVVALEQAEKDLGVNGARIQKILALIQNLDPPGVGARNLSECLLIQLQQKGLLDEKLEELIEKHLESIAAGKLSKVALALNVSVATVQEMADLIKTLNPKPGSSFGSGEDTRYIVPDVIVERLDDDYVILVNDNHIPHLTLNKTYCSILDQGSNADQNTREFVESKLNQAIWLLKSIEQRRMTIFQVTSALLKMQRQFFDRGIKYLKPLTLRQVAEVIGVHESTVSRATSNKYIQTPQGIFQYKFFFTTGLTTHQGESTSSESIKHTLQEIIKSEDSAKPYSDQKLADLLKERGIAIARRTVTKYREELNLPNTGQRRRY